MTTQPENTLTPAQLDEVCAKTQELINEAERFLAAAKQYISTRTTTEA